MHGWSVASFYEGLAATATRLLTAYGQSVTFTRTTSTSFDPVTGVDTVTTSTFSGYGAAFDYRNSEIDGERVQRGDIRLLVEATDTAPIIGDMVTVDGVDYRAMNVAPSSPGGTPTHYTVQLRR